ncbi:DUF2239 family protein [Cupriavidus plantarum]|uniref:DUF2239 family protein n=1 Tax=Cupriavidus plantarum TaxID=942865 RepID=UPI001B196A88|nr:DUF2239 family protein [Cupriavidus plantarum]CAG2141495.1 hypothetical protein LMG26296_03015 [Cupriavidus plantarum]SMR65311.1 hypothetical protein SAMN05421735_0157 [Cupriavidus plantarum]
MSSLQQATAFAGDQRLASGSYLEVALAIRDAVASGSDATVLAFDDATGRQIDFDLRGTDADIAARLAAPEAPNATNAGGERKRAGRPSLGVAAREVTLLPRHWEWLGDQPGGASATLRRLVDAASTSPEADMRRAQQTADRFMSVMLGNQPGYEEASRALYAADRERFMTLSRKWPKDLREHARKLAAGAFAG